MNFVAMPFTTNSARISITYLARDTCPCSHIVYNQSSAYRTLGAVTVIRIVQVCIFIIASARIIAAIRTTSTGKITAIRTTDARIVSTIGALGIASARVASTYETHIASTRIIPAIIATVAVVNVLSASSTILNQDFASATVVCMIQTTKGTIVDIIFPVDRITGS
jgi:hypothetical protein